MKHFVFMQNFNNFISIRAFSFEILLCDFQLIAIFIHRRSLQSSHLNCTSHNLQPQAIQNSLQKKKWFVMNIKRKVFPNDSRWEIARCFEKQQQRRRVSTLVTMNVRFDIKQQKLTMNFQHLSRDFKL
jgi:hypothetical protein